MSEPLLPTLEQQLFSAHEAIAKLTATNTDLTRQLSEAESRNKKLKRNSRNDESSFRSQLATAQSRRS